MCAAVVLYGCICVCVCIRVYFFAFEVYVLQEDGNSEETVKVYN